MLNAILVRLKRSPTETKFPCKVYDLPLYPKLHSLSRPAPGPLGIDEYQRKVGNETQQGPAGPSWVQVPQCPLLLARPSLSSKEQTQAVND